MTLRAILISASILISIFLLWDSCMLVDIAPAKNDRLISWKKADVDSINNIDSAKAIAKTNFDVIRQNFRNESKLAIRRIWVLLVFLIIQFYILIKWRSEPTT